MSTTLPDLGGSFRTFPGAHGHAQEQNRHRHISFAKVEDMPAQYKFRERLVTLKGQEQQLVQAQQMVNDLMVCPYICTDVPATFRTNNLRLVSVDV